MRLLPRLANRHFAQLLLTTLALLGSATTLAADVDGTLTMRWGDPVDGAGGSEKVQVEIVSKSGYTYAIDAAQALADGLPLFEMNGQDVVASLDPRRKSDAGFRLNGIASTSGAKSTSVSDARPWINLLCKFADNAAEPTTPAQMDAAFAPGAGLTQYWQQTSGGRIDLSRTRTLGWFVLPNATAYYFDANGNPNLTKLLSDCTSAAGAALSNAVQAEDHAGVNMMFNGSLGCCAWGGNTRTNIGGITKTWRVTWMPPAGYLNLSLLGHELGHTFGMSHSNNSDGDSNTYDNPWDLLSDSEGHATRTGPFGNLPKTPSAYHLDRAGWLNDDEKAIVGDDSTLRIDLQRVDQAAPGQVRMLKIESPAWSHGRYFMLEARVRGGAYDAALPDSGVVMYEVDPRRSQPAWLVDANDPAANYSNTRSVVFKPGDRYVAPDNSFELRVLSAGVNDFEVQVSVPGPGFDSGFE